jgi:sugar phosphate isomerase/epimerase
MIVPDISERLAVCSWSLRPASPESLAQTLLDLGIPRVQLALDPLCNEPAAWSHSAEVFAKAGIRIVSGMFGTLGEDYSTLESIKLTGGVVPDETWEQNWSHIKAVAAIAAGLGLSLVTFHAGFLPHDPADPAYAKLRDRIIRIARLFATHGINLGFETGQESADTLAGFLRDLGEPNVGVNFDPANMLLYAKGDPIQALRTLRPWLQQCHIKDALLTKVPGTWGEEVVTGTGEVDWNGFFATLAETGYTGNLCIEREAGEQRETDIRSARDFVLGLVG